MHSNISYDIKGFYFELNGNLYHAKAAGNGFSQEMFTSSIKGNKTALRFDFKSKGLNGILYYDFIPLKDSKFPQPVLFWQTAEIIEPGFVNRTLL